MLKKTLITLIALFCTCLTRITVLAQCPPTITLSSASASITIDDFADITTGVTRNGITNISINAGVGCTWDLFAAATLTQAVQYSPNGVPLDLTGAAGAIEISAFNLCRTPDHDYGAGSPPPPPRISTALDAPFAVSPNYLIGTAPGIADGLIAKAPAPCAGTDINGAGTASADPTTHTFRIDIKITPGMAPIIEPGLYDLAIDFSVMIDGALPDAFNLTSFNLQIEILPILQLKMSTSDQIDFIFSDITEYAAGITRYGATILSVSSSLDWDLMAVGTSSLNESVPGSPFWDQNLSYSAIGTPNILLRVLELHQIPGNPAVPAVDDYSGALTTPASGLNYIEVGRQVGPAIVFSTAGTRTIAGDWAAGGGGGVSSVVPGSYLIPPATDRYRYVISYRITPGLPVTFNGLMGEAQPGYYTMQIRYLLSVDQ